MSPSPFLTSLQTAPARAALLALGTRTVVLAVGLAASLAFGYDMGPSRFRLSHNELWNLPARFDAGWYLGIARHGYRWDPRLEGRQQNVAFFPAFPLSMRVAGELVTLPAHALRDPDLFGNGNTRVLWGGTLVSLCCFAYAATLLAKLVALRAPTAGVRTVALLATYPFALYFSAPYSESLFLLAAVSAFLAVEQNQHSTAAGWALLAGLTRPTGWALSVGLLWLVVATPERRRTVVAWMAALAPLAGTLAFSAYLWQTTGRPLVWVEVQRGWGARFVPLQFITGRLTVIQERGFVQYATGNPVDPFIVLAVVFTIGGAWLAAKRFGPAYGAFVLASIAPAVAIDSAALGRYTSVLFPSFMALAAALTVRQTWWVSAAFFLAQLWLAARFFTWQPPF